MSISDAAILTQVEGIDTMDLGMVGDGTFTSIVRDWAEISHIEVMPLADSLERDGAEIRIKGDLTITYADGGEVDRTISIRASDEEDVFGLRNIALEPLLAA